MAYKLKIRYMYRSTFNYSSTACHNFNFTLSIYKTLIFITLIFLPKTYAKENFKKNTKIFLDKFMHYNKTTASAHTWTLFFFIMNTFLIPISLSLTANLNHLDTVNGFAHLIYKNGIRDRFYHTLWRFLTMAAFNWHACMLFLFFQNQWDLQHVKKTVRNVGKHVPEFKTRESRTWRPRKRSAQEEVFPLKPSCHELCS